MTQTCAKHRRTRFGFTLLDAAGQQKKVKLTPGQTYVSKKSHYPHRPEISDSTLCCELRRLILYYTAYRDCMRNVKGCRARPMPIAWDDVPPIRSMACRTPGHIGRSSSEPYYLNSRVVGLGHAKVTLP